MNKQFKCPLCGTELTEMAGTVLSHSDGVTLYCSNRACPAQEVSGHGSTVKNAYQVIEQKFIDKPEQE